MARQPRILVLLEAPLAERAAAVLTSADHEVQVGSTSAPEHLLASYRPDVVVLDLPAHDPGSIRAAVRRMHTAHDPMLLCTVDGPEHWQAALDAGADAFLPKPYADIELEVSVRALVRRMPWLLRAEHHIGRVVIDERAHLVLFDGQPVDLGKKEFGILRLLAEHAGSVLSKRVLLEQLWGYDAYDENLVEAQVCGLRRRLPREAADLIQTVRGIGYVLRSPAPAEAPRTTVGP